MDTPSYRRAYVNTLASVLRGQPTLTFTLENVKAWFLMLLSWTLPKIYKAHISRAHQIFHNLYLNRIIKKMNRADYKHYKGPVEINIIVRLERMIHNLLKWEDTRVI